ncbi:MAG: hypothetical protein DRJ52_09425, partial [Thermoprotei archaeon]
ISLEKFLRMEGQYKNAFFALVEEMAVERIHIYEIVARFLRRSAEMLGEILRNMVDVPELIEIILERYNVSAKKLLKYIREELLAEEIIKEREKEKKEKKGKKATKAEELLEIVTE